MKAAVATLLFFAAVVVSGQNTLISRGSVWRYNATGTPEAGWQALAFDDTAWPSGSAQLGYGEGDEQTVIPVAPENLPTTIYFRRLFVVTNLALLNSATLRIVADDGAVVYLNGVEVARRNLPPGPISPLTPAVSNLQTNGNSFVQFGVYPFRLRPGTNILAVEVHQHPEGRADCSFDVEFLVDIPRLPPTVTIVSPTNNTVILQGNVTFEAAASDPDGHVAKVIYLTNGVPLGESLIEPFSLTWTNPAVGHYQVVARAYDNYLSGGSSSAIHVQVGSEARPQLFRGPYLQSGSSTGIVVRWRTDWYAESVIRYGTNSGSLDESLIDATPKLEHELEIRGLVPDMAYYYSVGSLGETYASGEEFRFQTSPTNARPLRIWVIGDSGTADRNAAQVRDAYYAEAATDAVRTDLWLMLGDNAYGEGLDRDFTAAVFNMYPELLRKSVLWPALGNHEAGDTSPGGDASVYLENFTLPTRGEAGGIASGTELYYSFDYANIHFVCLDSFLSDNSPNGTMVTWLKADLEATEKEWIIAYWHHPPYSWGTHNSDAEYFMSDMREHVVPVLEDYGVDLVLTGHSHNYERSFLLNGHYGSSETLQPAMILDGGGGGASETPPYRKPAGGIGANRGAVYAVCGCSGQGGLDEGYPLHPAMAVNHGGFGSMILDVDGLKLRARFLRPSMAIDDTFAIDKSSSIKVRPELQIRNSTNGALVSWPTSLPQFQLESAQSLASPHWDPVNSPAKTIGRRNIVPVDLTATNRFFQLRSIP